jgi:hypothetical protein
MWGDVLDPQGDDVAAPQLAVYREVEHRQIPQAAVHLELGPDRPNVLDPQRRLRADHFSLVPRDFSRGCSFVDEFGFHARSPLLERPISMRLREGLWNLRPLLGQCGR